MFADMEYRTVNDNIESMKTVFRDKDDIPTLSVEKKLGSEQMGA